jgi:uncharacterized protein
MTSGMLSSLQEHSPASEVPALLILATSGRSLAQSARRAGYLPLTVDFFGDLDTRHAGPVQIADGDFTSGFDQVSLKLAVGEIKKKQEPVALVYGSGFEDKPDLLNALEDDVPILGNRAQTIKDVKDPFRFASACSLLGLPHPEIQSWAPPDIQDWIFKQHGGSGGSHIVRAAQKTGRNKGYYQKIVEGRAVSVLFVSNGAEARIIGFSEQWCDPTENEPYRYGGAITPATLNDQQETWLTDAAMALAQHFGLRGLNSVDFLINSDCFHVLEINPRPGATLDIFDDASGQLMHLHISSSTGKCMTAVPETNGYRAAKIVYARVEIASVPAIAWPDWAADQQSPGTRIEAGWPICTILAQSSNRQETLALLAEREAVIRRQLEDFK